jgi:hypothetical protein
LRMVPPPEEEPEEPAEEPAEAEAGEPEPPDLPAETED